jgi:hypothetical protein
LSRRRQKKSFDLASGKKIPREVYSFGNTVWDVEQFVVFTCQNEHLLGKEKLDEMFKDQPQ